MFMMPVRMSRSKPAITELTMIKIATPSSGPRIDSREITEMKVRLGLKYRSAKKMSSGRRKVGSPRKEKGKGYGQNIMR